MAGGSDASCGFGALIVFIGALIAGTACSLTSKVMLSMKSVGMTGEEEEFSYPLFQTFGMFLGMTAGLVMHFIVVQFRIPLPGYNHTKGDYKPINGEIAESDSILESPKSVPLWMYGLLAIPAVFDLVATAFCMFGLRYVNVSIYQMLRGSAIVFVAILKHYVLGDKLKRYQWVGVGWNVVSIILVGTVAILASSSGSTAEGGGSSSKYNNPLVGVCLILMGALVQSLQYAFEEKVMSMEIPAPPLLLIGMEGFWGSLICLFILYPLAYYFHGSDHGSIENPFNTIAMISNSPEIQSIFCLYFISIFCYNILACLVTFMLNSVWHAILDNFRPISVWGTDLFIFYVLTTSFGESWTIYSWIQALGLVILLYGTAVYNAPNAGSIKLRGELFNCCINCSDEYADTSGLPVSVVEPAITTNTAPAYLHTMSPFMSPRTQQSKRSELKRRDYGTESNVQMKTLTKKGSFA